MMARRGGVAVICLFLALITSGCVVGSLRPDGARGPIDHRLADSFVVDPPSCVFMPPPRDRAGMPVSGRQIDRAVERFLAVRFDRVLAGFRRDRLARRLALDLTDDRDIEIFARRADCGHVLRVTPHGGGSTYAVVWAERRIGLDLALYRVGNPDRPLWWARHAGSEGDGGLPISPLSVAGAMVRAARTAGDTDQAFSLLDDVLRRIMKSLPDVRGFAMRGAGRGRSQAAPVSMNSTVMPSGSRR